MFELATLRKRHLAVYSMVLATLSATHGGSDHTGPTQCYQDQVAGVCLRVGVAIMAVLRMVIATMSAA